MIPAIWHSFRSLPIWVQIWVGLILMPVNAATLLFLDQPGGALIASLALGGMALNLPIVLLERGFSKAMALPHLLFWTPLVIILIERALSSEGLTAFLWLLLIIDLISLGFDYPDAVKWMRGDRAVAGR